MANYKLKECVCCSVDFYGRENDEYCVDCEPRRPVIRMNPKPKLDGWEWATIIIMVGAVLLTGLCITIRSVRGVPIDKKCGETPAIYQPKHNQTLQVGGVRG